MLTTACKMASWGEDAMQYEELSLTLRGEGREEVEGGRGDMYTYGWFRCCMAKINKIL